MTVMLTVMQNNREQTLAGGVLYTKDLIGMMYAPPLLLLVHKTCKLIAPLPSSTRIYYIFFIAIMKIPPERLQRPFIVSSVLFGGT